MKNENQVKLPPAVSRGFRQFRRRFRFFVLNRGLLLTIAACLCWILLAVAADRLLRLPATWRLALLIVTVASSAFVLIYFGIRPLLRRLHNRRVAARIGRAMPDVEDELVSAVELAENGTHMEGVSTSLVHEALEDIDRDVKSADFRKPVRLRRLLYFAASAAAVIAIATVAYHLRPEAFGNAFQRLTQPFKDIAFFCYTRLEVSPGDLVLARGDETVVTAAVGGRVPTGATVEVTETSTTAQKQQWFNLENEAADFVWRTGPLFETVRYRVYAGDAISRWYTLQVEPPPTVVGKAVEVRYPDYAARGPKRIENLQGPLEIVTSSRVRLLVRSTRAVEAWLLHDNKEIPLVHEGSGWFGSPVFAAVSEAEYAIGLEDKYKLRNRGTETIHLKAIEDPLPAVNIQQPTCNLTLLPHESVEVSAFATDNLGLRGLAIAFQKIVADKPETLQHVELAKGEATAERLTGKTVLAMSELGIKPGEQLQYWAEASDFAGASAARCGKSNAYRIIVLSEQEYIRMAMGELHRLSLDVLRLAKVEGAEAAATSALAEQDKEKLESPQTAKAAEAAAERQAKIAKQTEDVAKAVEQVAVKLTRAPSAPESLMAKVERIAQALRSIKAGEMARAAKELAGAAASDEAEERKEKLDEAGDEQETAAEKLHALADEMKKASDQGLLESLAEIAARLAREQQNIAAASGKLAPKTAGKDPNQLPEDQKKGLDSLTEAEKDIKEAIRELEKNLKQAASALSHNAPSAAKAASEAAEALKSDAVAQNAAGAQELLRKNLVFSSIPKQKDVAKGLEKVAKMLREELPELKPLAALEETLLEFIRRQQEVVSQIEGRLNWTGTGTEVPVEKTAQAEETLKREVTEQATALDLLALEIEGFESLTAGRLRAAARAMRDAAEFLRKADDKEALPPAAEALKLLKGAQEAFAGGECNAFGACEISQAMIELQRILAKQKHINKGTQTADESRPTLKDEVLRTILQLLASKQGETHDDTGRFLKKYRFGQKVEKTLTRSAELMETSRVALDGADTGEETRIVQKQIVSLLESLFCAMQGHMAGMANAAGVPCPGGGGGGFTGGENANISLLKPPVGNTDWKGIRSKYEGKITGGWEEVVAPEFRELLDAYFESIRKGD